MSEDFTIKEYWKYDRDMTPSESSWYLYYLKKFRRLALNVYKWDNVPEGVDPFLIERYLFEDGQCIVWNSPTFGLSVARADVTEWDAWKKPLKLRPRYDGITEVMDEISIDECAFITDMYMYGDKRRNAFILISELIAIQDIIDTQNANQATPILAISGNTKTKDKLKNCIYSIAHGLKVMFVEDDITNSLKPLNLNAPYNVTTLVQYKKDIENEILSYLGIDSQQAYQKKERMIVDEQEGNDELLNYLLADGLKGRQRGIDDNSIGFKPTVEIQTFVRPEMTDNPESNADKDKSDNDDVQTD